MDVCPATPKLTSDCPIFSSLPDFSPTVSEASSPALSSSSSVASSASFRFSPPPDSPGSSATTASPCLSDSPDFDCSDTSACPDFDSPVAPACAILDPVAVASSVSVDSVLSSPSLQASCSAAVSIPIRPAFVAAACRLATPLSNTLRLYDFTEGSFIGHGAFGKVHLVTHHDTGTKCAIKSIVKEAGVESTVFQERDILHSVRGTPNVVELMASFHDDKNYYLVMVSRTLPWLLLGAHMVQNTAVL